MSPSLSRRAVAYVSTGFKGRSLSRSEIFLHHKASLLLLLLPNPLLLFTFPPLLHPPSSNPWSLLPYPAPNRPPGAHEPRPPLGPLHPWCSRPPARPQPACPRGPRGRLPHDPHPGSDCFLFVLFSKAEARERKGIYIKFKKNLCAYTCMRSETPSISWVSHLHWERETLCGGRHGLRIKSAAFHGRTKKNLNTKKRQVVSIPWCS